MSTLHISLYKILQLMEVELIAPTVTIFVYQQFQTSQNIGALFGEEAVHRLDISI